MRAQFCVDVEILGSPVSVTSLPKAPLRMDLSFSPNEEGDILNTTIRDSDTGSIMYTVETPKRAGGTLTTTITRRNQIDGSTRLSSRILWNGTKGSLEDAKIVLDFRTLEEVPAREVLGSAPGSTT